MAAIKRKGYAQVQPNHLSAQYTGQIYAQLPAKTSGGESIATLENGQFLKYNYAAGRASVDGQGEWMLVYNEEKLYDERRQNHKDFCMKASEQADGVIYPRLLKTNVGDIFTTNAFTATSNATVTGPDDEITTTADLAATNYLEINSSTGWLQKANALPEAPAIAFQVVKVYTLPDGQAAVKIQRIQ